MRVFVFVLACVVCASAQMIPWEQPKSTVNSTAVTIPKCSGTNKNCWSQTAGSHTVLSQVISAATFPCKSGTSGTTWTIQSPSAIAGNEGNCRITCTGIGCKNSDVGLCTTPVGADGLYMGIKCPIQAGNTHEAIGPARACNTGLGSYTITLTCPIFTVITYLTY